MSKEKILVVDDEVEISELIQDYLEEEGYEVKLAFDGKEALEIFRNYQPHLMILDVMLPKIDGMEVCRLVRAESAIPILMLSAKKSDIDKILGLGLGADDYVTKPFSPAEIVARVRAQLRRFLQMNTMQNKMERLRFKGLIIDFKSYSVIVSERMISLSGKEFEVLKLLAMHPMQVFTREQIFDRVWGYEEYGDINTVTVHIRKLREKIEQDPSNPQYIKTVWGIGYKFEGVSE
ncbi:MAG: response regulator transcription factor [Clostridia bacterium]|nr:response regulator transcription factor [Clostridia bacterium]